jgi:hypothetical protein
MEYTFPGRPPARPSCIIVICTWGRRAYDVPKFDVVELHNEKGE